MTLTSHSSRSARTFHTGRFAAIGLGALALSATAFALFGIERSADHPKKTQRPAPSITVNVASPVPVTFSRSIAATGTVSARDELIIGSDAAGVRLTEVLVEVGSTVQKGQLLARGDDTQLRAQLAQQEALVKQAQSELVLAQGNLERAERLARAGFYSAEAVQTRQSSADGAIAKLEMTRAQRHELEVQVAHTRIVAPANGVIAKRSATVGAVVQPGTELFRLIRDAQLEWLAELPSHSLIRLQPGTSARITLDDGRQIEGRVRLVAPTMDQATRNGIVYISLPMSAPLKAGAHAKGEIFLGTAAALAIPESSVLTRDGYSFVYVVGADDVARLTRVETGARQDGFLEVSAGLSPDVRVVSTGAGFVKDGELVRVAPESNQRLAHLGGQS